MAAGPNWVTRGVIYRVTAPGLAKQQVIPAKHPTWIGNTSGGAHGDDNGGNGRIYHACHVWRRDPTGRYRCRL